MFKDSEKRDHLRMDKRHSKANPDYTITNDPNADEKVNISMKI